MRSAISCFVNFDEIMFYTWSRTVYSFSPPSRLFVIENKKSLLHCLFVFAIVPALVTSCNNANPAEISHSSS